MVTAQHAYEAPEQGTVWSRSAAIFRRWRDGEREALDELVRCLTPVLWQVVRSYGIDRDRAEDVVQTTWLTLVRRHDSIADPQAVASWLTTTARREAWRVAKSDARARPVEDELLETQVPSQQSAEREAIVADEGSRLWASVRQLPARCQRLLRIVAFDDRPDYAGIARDLNMPIGSIGPTRGRCLDKLKALLAVQTGVDDE